MALGTNIDLFTFIRSGARNAWVNEYGFDALYVRHGWRYINDEKIRTLELASIKATTPGEGAFTRLIDQIQVNFPNLWIYVENVQTERFGKGLERLGFFKDPGWKPEHINMSYYLEPLTSHTKLIEAIKL